MRDSFWHSLNTIQKRRTLNPTVNIKGKFIFLLSWVTFSTSIEVGKSKNARANVLHKDIKNVYGYFLQSQCTKPF